MYMSVSDVPCVSLCVCGSVLVCLCCCTVCFSLMCVCALCQEGLYTGNSPHDAHVLYSPPELCTLGHELCIASLAVSSVLNSCL